MTDYQKNKIEELKNQGWSDASVHIPGYIYRAISVSGIRAYIYPNWTQFIV